MKVFITVLAVLLLTAPAWAQDSAEFDREVLGAIETVPTRAALDASYPDARERLERAVFRTKGYARDRAITLLSFYPDHRTRVFLEGLLTNEETDVRRMAVYTLGRAFGTHSDAALVAVIERVIRDDNDEVAGWAIRALRWVEHDDAARALKLVANGSDERKARFAKLALRRRITPTR